MRCCCYLRLHRHSDVTLITIRSKKRRKKEMNVVRKINHVSYCIYYYYYPHKSNEIMTLWKITSRGLFHSATKTKIKEMSECWQLLCSAKISRMKFDLHDCSYFTNYIHIVSILLLLTKQLYDNVIYYAKLWLSYKERLRYQNSKYREKYWCRN